MNLSQTLHWAEPAPFLTPSTIGRAATRALYHELALEPKPGLVTLSDNGSHSDMDAQTFMRSLFALRGYFVNIAELGRQQAGFVALERCGIQAEAQMLAATGGINTHRGAIFMLGLLCAAAGALSGHAVQATPARLRAALRQHWGDALTARSQRTPTLPGGIAAQRHGLRSASQEAAMAFPVLFETAVPALASALARGLRPEQARLDTLFQVMAVLDDSNLAHRGGIEGLRHAQQSARDFLAAGGSARADGLEAARAIGHDFVVRNLSPGGAADTLAAACWMLQLCDPGPWASR
ncbi:triphosphoribosyl-dephospho-CoA synthase MdcB [Rhodoferax sp.]|uniref:triphosphoribosyl-dephospho-CoA synthase MdcB n=1 Tax=Rhodoferax sp. TaxID=50421 RepID=UPI00374DE31D